MCHSNSRGHHDDHSHHHGSQPIRTHSSARAIVTPDFQPTRRQVLGQLMTAGLLSAASGSPLGSLVKAIADENQLPPRGQAQATLFDFKKVADGIYGAIAKPTAMLNCNAAVIVNRDHVLVVDTHSKPSAAKALIRQIRDEITQLPVRYVVDSHLHGDHAMGNEAYPEVFGGNVEVISSVEDARVDGEARLVTAKGVDRLCAKTGRRASQQAGNEQGRIGTRHPQGTHRGTRGIQKGDDASARDSAVDDFRAATRSSIAAAGRSI